MWRKENGMSLIVLLVSIIVLLVLAGLTIKLVIDQNKSIEPSNNVINENTIQTQPAVENTTVVNKDDTGKITEGNAISSGEDIEGVIGEEKPVE